jgi:hypothetical protein
MDDLRDIARKALEAVRTEIRWKPGKGAQHLERRIQLEQLPEGTTLDEYEGLIACVLSDLDAEVDIYDWRGTPYPVATAVVDGERSMVMVSAAGIMETAFLVTQPGYLEQKAFTRLGTLAELTS